MRILPIAEGLAVRLQALPAMWVSVSVPSPGGPLRGPTPLSKLAESGKDSDPIEFYVSGPDAQLITIDMLELVVSPDGTKSRLPSAPHRQMYGSA